METANEAQVDHWNGEESAHWVTQQDRYDAMLEPFIDVILEAARLTSTDRVMDIGCGCGATTTAAARRVAKGAALGFDLSAQMLERARHLAQERGQDNVVFEQADAQVHRFTAGECDAAISRFGVMFFADPVAAFANMRKAVRSGGRLAFVSWRDRPFQEWLLVPTLALAPFAPSLPPAPPDAPGMMGLADEDRVRRILSDAGWSKIDLAPVSRNILFGGRGTVDDAVDFMRTGTIGRTLLADLDAPATAAALAAVRDAFAPFSAPDGVALGSSVWLVTAVA